MQKVRISIILCIFIFLTSQLYIKASEPDMTIGKYTNINTKQLTPVKSEIFDQGTRITSLYAKEAILIDGDTGRVLYEKDGYTRHAMASTTKIMTAIYVIENCDLNEIATVSERAASQPKVHLGASVGEQYKVQDLLYALMLESYNDCAVVLAEQVSGSVEEFCKAMTQKAKELGCEDTNFETPNGLDSDSHYTTPYDLARITKYALENQTFSDIVKTREYSFSEVNGKRTVTVFNKDGFLSQYEGAIGVKTGFTGKAGYCFVGAIKHDGKYLISVVFASGWPPNKTYKWQDTIALMKYGESNYEKCQVISPQEIVGEVTVTGGTKQKVALSLEGGEELLLSDSDQIETKLSMEQQLEAPVKKNQKVGSLFVYVNGQCQEILDIRTTEKAGEETLNMVIHRTILRLFAVTESDSKT
jgi:D-alanyl-D-alanine carboxypeptidase (penicillin-binding protein 5/6)